MHASIRSRTRSVRSLALVGIALGVFGACSNSGSSAVPSIDTPGDPDPVEDPLPRVDPDRGTEWFPTADIRFDDVSSAVGIDHVGLTFGISAGDLDGDGWPDVFANGHYAESPRLWRNRGDGTFENLISRMEPAPSGDLHGAQWFDWDNDGRDELLILRGAGNGRGQASNLFYVARGDRWVEEAARVQIGLDEMRARTPMAIDYQTDGLLDVLLTALKRPDGQLPPALLLQRPGGAFEDAGPSIGFRLDTLSEFAVGGDLDRDLRPDILVHGFPARVFAIGDRPIRDISSAAGWPTLREMEDAVIGDFDGDGFNEVYVANGRLESDVHLEGDRSVEFLARVERNEHGIAIAPSAAGSTLVLRFGPTGSVALDSVFLGRAGRHPFANDVPLDSSDPAHHGIAAHAPGVDEGIYAGFDPHAQVWRIAVSSTRWQALALRADLDVAVTAIARDGFESAETWPDQFLAYEQGRYVDVAARRGIDLPGASRSVVAADFDNDMDLDIYVVTTRAVCNDANVLFENLGDGCFARRRAFGGEGSARGRGDAVITLDYDRDGRVDLLLANGSYAHFNPYEVPRSFSDDGPTQLLRNTTQNDNRWLAIELVGRTPTTRSAIGARIEVLAGGKRQVREHVGGIHRYSQNHGVHFGLGPHAVAERVDVFWPSGRRTTQFNVPSNARISIVE